MVKSVVIHLFSKEGHIDMDKSSFKNQVFQMMQRAGSWPGSRELSRVIFNTFPVITLGSVQQSLFPFHSSEPGFCQLLCFSKLLSISHFLNQLIIQLTVGLNRWKPKLCRISPISLQVNSVNMYHGPAALPNAGGVGWGRGSWGVSRRAERPVPSLGDRIGRSSSALCSVTHTFL